MLGPLTKIGCMLGSDSRHRSNRLNPPTFIAWTILSFIRRVLRVTARGRHYTKGKYDHQNQEKRVEKDISVRWILVVLSTERQRFTRCRAQRRRLSSCKRANGWEGLYLSYA
jgi:hypothetical protein